MNSNNSDDVKKKSADSRTHTVQKVYSGLQKSGGWIQSSQEKSVTSFPLELRRAFPLVRCAPPFPVFPSFHSCRRRTFNSEGEKPSLPLRRSWGWPWAATSSFPQCICVELFLWSLFTEVLAEVSTSKHLQMRLSLNKSKSTYSWIRLVWLN